MNIFYLSYKNLARNGILLLVFVISFSSFSDDNLLSPSNKYSSFPMVHNHKVQAWIHYFAISSETNYMKLWLKRSYRYFPTMKEILKQKNLPEDLVYMTLIESSLSPKAVSSANAVGYWQFIQPTALRFGLRVNHWVDERRDFEKSTYAATRYLHTLYQEFGDWLLVMAAYNMGESRLRNLIKKYDSRDFWILSNKSDFPQETAQYIPKILAANQLIKYPERYGVSQFKILTPYKYDVFFLPGGVDLNQICRDTQLSCAKIKLLNPHLKKYQIPKTVAHHKIRIPEGQGIAITRWLKKNQSQL